MAHSDIGAASGKARSSDTSGSHPNNLAPAISVVATADLPALAEAELLSFSGTNPADVLARRLHPFRAGLARARIPPRRWLDFLSTLRRNETVLRDKKNILLKAELTANLDCPSLSSERDVPDPVGMAWLRLPGPPITDTTRDPSKISQKLLSLPDLSRARDTLIATLADAGADGTDITFYEVFRTEMARARKDVENRILNGAPYASLEIIFVHPAHRGIGAGAALLSHCIKVAESVLTEDGSGGLPILLESTCTATPLYLRYGFREVYRSRITYGGVTYEWPVMLRYPVQREALS